MNHNTITRWTACGVGGDAVITTAGGPGPSSRAHVSRRPALRFPVGLVFLLFVAAAASAADEPELSVSVGVSSRSMLSAIVAPALRWPAGLFGLESTVGLRAEVPVLLAAAGEADTFRLSLTATQELLGQVGRRHLGNRTSGVWPSLILHTALGWDYQDQVLGRFSSLTATVALDFGVRLSRFRFGFVAGWAGALATHWQPSSAVIDTFNGTCSPAPAPEPAPAGALLGPDAGRFRYGISVESVLSGVTGPGPEPKATVTLGARLLGVFTPDPFVRGFDGMMFGQWPFALSVGVRVSGHR